MPLHSKTWFWNYLMVLCSSSMGPWLGEAAPQPEGNSVCAQKAPARLGFPGALPHALQYACLENSMDRGAWEAIVHGVALVRSAGDIQEGDLVEVVLSGERPRPA